MYESPLIDRKVRQFSLSQSFLEQFVGKQPNWGPVGLFTYKRTYARPSCDCDDTADCGHPSEEFWETCKRVVEGVYNVQKTHCRQLTLPWNESKAQASAQDMFQRMWEFKWTPPGRGLWMMGTPFMLQKGGACINNCAFVSSEHIEEDFSGPFAFLMDMSMLGVGVGSDTRGAGKVKIHTPKCSGSFQVEDSREGWVSMVKACLNPFVGKGSFPHTIDFTQLRAKGKRIHGFGGTSSGPGPLAKLAKNIARTLVPEGVEVTFKETFHPETGEVTFLQVNFEGEGKPYKITSGGITDIFNLVGACVVAGGVRRSAEIMFGQPDDQEFRTLKDPTELIELDKVLSELFKVRKTTTDENRLKDIDESIAEMSSRIENHPLRSHRWASNNSIFCEVGMDYSDVAPSIAKNGEPGILWLKNAQNYGRMIDPPDYKDVRALGANPCFAGETLIAVADGRGAVSIRQLVEEGNDVPVYSVDSDGMVEIKMARRPRMTREFSELVEIKLDDGTSFKVTPDHKMLLLDGTKCEAKDLVPGDSLPRLSKHLEPVVKGGNNYLLMHCNTRNSNKNKVFEHRMISKFCHPEVWEERFNLEEKSGWIRGGLVVHHKDYNPLNNSPDNLDVMSFREHSAIHSRDNTGEKNSMWGKTHSEETRKKIGQKTTERCLDPVFLAKLKASHTEAERQETAERMSEQQKQFWYSYYKEQEAKTDLTTVWMENRMHAVKSCETCEAEFIVPWRNRGQCYCNNSCKNKAESHIKSRVAGQRIAFENKQRQTLHEQVRIFKDLSESLNRVPMRKEWEHACKSEGVSFCFRNEGETTNPHALYGYTHLQQTAQEYNHRVVSVTRLEKGEPVFNLSVEDNHTVGIATSFDPVTKACGGIFAFQCSEQTLESFELCTLVETYPAHHDSYEDFAKTLKVAYLYAKTVTLIPTHDPRTNAVMNRNRRIGCSMSGIQQAVGRTGRREFLNWCDRGYKHIQKLDRLYSEWLGVPLSIKTTSIKPSGCQTPDTEIRTCEGDMSLFDLFFKNGVDLSGKTSEYREWYPVTYPLHVLDLNGDAQEVTRLFVNGFEETIKLTLEDGVVLESTPDHKFLLSSGEWRSALDLMPGDDLAVKQSV